jgi:pimeloyl-ACP methyl ester carboxylesterase
MLRSFSGGDLLGEVWGTSQPRVLALHGWRRTHEDFAAVIGPRAPTGACAGIAVDLPGFGASPPPPEVWGSDEYALLVAKMLDDLGQAGPPGPFVVLGHSFGGRVAVHLAARRPDLVRALVLTAAPIVRTGPARKPPAPYRWTRALRRARLVPESVLERARERYGSADYLAAQGIMRQILVRVLAERYEQQLASLSCPVELVWGDDDNEVPLAVAEALVKMVPQAVLTVCPGAGHLTPLTVPERLREAVDRVLDASCGAGAR